MFKPLAHVENLKFTLAETVSSVEPSERELVQLSWTLQLPVLVLILEADTIVSVRVS